MTDHERDELEGRVNRELREAEKELKELLVKAEQVAKEIDSLAGLIKSRVSRASLAGGIMVEVSSAGNRERIMRDSGIEIGTLKRYEKAVDLDEIDALDKAIGEAVAKVLKARQQKAQLGV